MKLAVISDTHFGDTSCGLVKWENQTWVLDEDRFNKLREETRGPDDRPADFLIMVGDVFDFSIATYREAYEAGKIFFTRAGELARDVIYLPGNHDCDLWHLVDYEISVIKKIIDGKDPGQLMKSVPAILDDREDHTGPRLFWPTTNVIYECERARQNEGNRTGIFIDNLFHRDPANKAPDAPCFWMAYPNLYLRTRDAETILITHGHYFRDYWAWGSELAIELAGNERVVPDPDNPLIMRKLVQDLQDHQFGRYLRLPDAVGVNFPLSQLACSGIGQADPITAIARKIQHRIKQRDSDWVDQNFLAKLPDALTEAFELGWQMSGALKLFFTAARPFIRKRIRVYKDAQRNPEFLQEKSVRENLGRFILATFREIDEINKQLGFADADAIKYPRKMIYGHTHERTPWDLGHGDPAPNTIESRPLYTFNPGGWLMLAGSAKVPGELFIYQSEVPGGFHSISID